MSVTAVSSVSLLKREIDKFTHILGIPETEDSWDSLLKGIQSFTAACENGACDWPEELIQALRSLARPLISAMNSERTRLSGVAVDFIAVVTSGLGSAFEPLLPIFFPTLLTLSGRTNKVTITRARACITTIIETAQLPSILPYFLQSLRDKSASLRLTAAEGTLTCMNCFNPPDLEKDSRAREIEAVIRATARDANADIRKVSRKIFEAYKLLLPGRVDNFIGPLSPTMKKYLDVASLTTRPQSTIASLTTKLEARDLLSASTPTVSSTLRPTQLLQRQTQHLRSISSSALSTKGQLEKSIGPKPEKSDMPPPQYMPIRPTQPNHPVSSIHPAPVTDSRRRAVSVMSKPAVEQVELSKTAGTNATLAYPTRPASVNSLRNLPHALESNLAPRIALQTSAVSGPRRVPLPEVSKETTLVDTEVSKSQIIAQPTQGNSVSIRKSNEVKSAVRRADPVSGNRHKISSITTTGEVDRYNPKPNRVTQPTLAQLARAKPIIERKAPTVAGSKPLWGSRPTSKVPAKKVSPQDSTRKVVGPLVTKPRSQVGGRSVTPAQIPLPPSPTLIATVAPSSRPITPSELSSPALVTSLLSPIKSSPNDQGDDENINETHVKREISSNITYDTEVPASDTNQHSSDSVHDNEGLSEDTLIEGMGGQKPATPRGLLTSRANLDSASNTTPISALLSSIQQGFLFTPSSPLSPPQSYLPQRPVLEGMKNPIISFPLNNNESDALDGTGVQEKPFMFGVGSNNDRKYALGNVENLDVL